MSELTEAWSRYKSARKRLKAKYNLRIEEELHNEKVRVGEAISNARAGGMKVDEVAFHLGTRNRNTQYDLLRLFELSRIPDEPDEETTTQDDEAAYRLTRVNGDDFMVKFPGSDKEFYLEYSTDTATFTMPPVWATGNREARKLYKEIIQEATSIVRA